MSLDLGFYWALFLRRVPVMALFAILFSGLGVVTALKLPETYTSSARLLMESPQIPDSMVTSVVNAGARQQLDVIQQRLMTRANLIDLANRFDVFEDLRELEPDTVTALMRDATTIRRRGGGGRGDASVMMTISFDARSPQIAASVVNEYVTLVLQENSRFRVSRAENTLEFFEQEVGRLSGELSRQSVEIANFKNENAKALPQDQTFRLSRQNLLQERLNRLEGELVLAEQQRENLKTSIDSGRRPVGSAPSPYEEELVVVRAEIARLRESYAENNPRIIRLNDRINSLEAIVAARTSAGGSDSEGDGGQPLLQAALREVDNKITAISNQIASSTAELEELERNISKSPGNATRLDELEREHSAIQTRYNSALSNLNVARMSERVEATAQGQRINVIENANVPQIPSGPNRPLIGAIGIITGLGLAIGYFVLLEVLNREIRRPVELVERFNISPMATIPYMESGQAKLFRRSALIVTTLAVLVGVPFALWYVDTYYLPLEVVMQRVLARVGLG